MPAPPVLVRPRLVEDHDLQASPLVSWVVDVELPRPMHRDRFLPLFPPDWRLASNVSLHAFCPDTGRWSYPESSGVPERYTRLQLAVALAGVDLERDGEELEAILADVKARLAGAGIEAVTTRPTLEEALARAAVIGELLEDLEDARAGVALVAPDDAAFALDDVRRVLASMDLAEGDLEDGFAWLNDHDAPGDDVLFTVHLELAGDAGCAALRFALHPARTAEPIAILDQLFRAAEHARAELGGRLEGLEGEPFDAAATRAWVEKVAARLRAAGLEPGGYHTMTVF